MGRPCCVEGDEPIVPYSSQGPIPGALDFLLESDLPLHILYGYRGSRTLVHAVCVLEIPFGAVATSLNLGDFWQLSEDFIPACQRSSRSPPNLEFQVGSMEGKGVMAPQNEMLGQVRFSKDDEKRGGGEISIYFSHFSRGE